MTSHSTYLFLSFIASQKITVHINTPCSKVIDLYTKKIIMLSAKLNTSNETSSTICNSLKKEGWFGTIELDSE